MGELCAVPRRLLAGLAWGLVWAGLVALWPNWWDSRLWTDRTTFHAEPDPGVTADDQVGLRLEQPVVRALATQVPPAAALPAGRRIKRLPNDGNRLPYGCEGDRSGAAAAAAGPTAPGIWYLVGDTTRQRVHLVCYRAGRPTLWLARGGFQSHAPAAADRFTGAVGEQTLADTVPSVDLRPGVRRADCWPQPPSWLLAADDAVWEADPLTRRLRRLFELRGALGVSEADLTQLQWPERTAEPAANYDPLRLSESKLAPRTLEPLRRRVIIARTATGLCFYHRLSGRRRDITLPPVLRAERLRCVALPDGNLAAVIAPVDGDLYESLHYVRFDPQGRVLAESTQRLPDVPERQPRSSRAVLAATCRLLPRLLVWASVADADHAQPLPAEQVPVRRAAWLLGALLVLHILHAAGRGELGWAITALVLGLPGWLAWRTAAGRRAGRSWGTVLPARRRGPRPVAALVAKELAELLPLAAVAVLVAVTTGVLRVGIGPLLAAPGSYDALVTAFGDLPRALAPVGLLLGLALAARQTWPEGADHTWQWLRTRPLPRGYTPLRIKLAVGLSLTLAASALPPAVMAGWMALPQAWAGPLRAWMLVPAWWTVAQAGVAYLTVAALGCLRLTRRRAWWAVTIAAWCLIPRVADRYSGGGWSDRGEPLPDRVADTLDYVKSERYTDRFLVLGHDGQARLRLGESPFSGMANTLRGGHVADLVGHIETVEGDLWPMGWWVPRPAEASGRGLHLRSARWMTGRETWLVVRGDPDGRRGYLVGYDSRTWRCVGWYGQRGLVDRQPSAAEQFPVPVGAPGLLDGRGQSGSLLLWGDDGRLWSLAPWRRQMTPLLTVPGLRRAESVSLSRFGNLTAGAEPAVIVETATAVAIYHIERERTDTWTLPAELRGRLDALSMVPGGPMVGARVIGDDAWELVWFDRGGRISRRATARLDVLGPRVDWQDWGG